MVAQREWPARRLSQRDDGVQACNGALALTGMDRTAPELELLMVADSVHAVGDMLVLSPDFEVPEDGWRRCTTPARIVTPAGVALEGILTLQIAHYRIRPLNLGRLDRTWRVVASFRHLARDAVAPGSRILVEPGTIRRLTSKAA